MFSPQRILVPTDFSEYSDNTLQLAIDLAKQLQSKIYLLHVVGIVIQYMVGYSFDPKMVNLLDDESVPTAEKMLREQLEKFPDSKSIEIITDIRKGTPAYEEILRYQQEKKIDLIVISSHGKTGLLSHLIGSVAERVVRSATCPVLLVK